MTAPPAGGAAAFVVELEQFSGPLDLLVTLIRDEQVEIADVPIAAVAEQFLRRIHALGLSTAAEYLEMAARLLRIKAQMLLPRGERDDWEDPRAELIRHLLEYQQMREAVDRLERLGELRRNRFARGEPPGQPVLAPAPLALSVSELLGAVDRVLHLVRRPAVHDIVPRALDVDGAIASIRSALAARARLVWRDLVAAHAEPWQVLSALLALLELARRGELRLRQHAPFAHLEIAHDAAGEAA